MTNGWKTYGGVLHVHTEEDGGAPLKEIVESARRAGVDFVLLADSGSDYNSQKKIEGWHDDVLVLVAGEICLGDGQFIAGDLRHAVAGDGELATAIENVRRQGGAIIGTQYQVGAMKVPSHQPPPLPMDFADMVVVWSFFEDFITNARGRLAIQHQGSPERLLSGPHRPTLAAWDEQLRKRQLPALGTLNLYSRKDPLLDWKEYFSCAVAFKTIRTHVLCPELPKRKSASNFLWKAIRAGHSYIVNHAVGNPEGFRFQYRDADGKLRDMGETVLWSGNGTLVISLPTTAEVIIRYNGHALFWGTGQAIEFPAVGPGVYRLEVRNEGRCWILTNPIRVVHPGSDASGKATVVDFT